MDGGINILVVDDNPAMTKTLADILALNGYNVSLAYSGEEALKIIHQEPIDLVISDVKMPDMDGVALFRELRKSYPKLTTILMTAYAADEIIQEGLAEGIRTILTKPLDINFLLVLLAATGKQSPNP